MIFNNENFSFGNPIDQTWKKLSGEPHPPPSAWVSIICCYFIAGRLSCEIEPLHEQLTSLKFESYKVYLHVHVHHVVDFLFIRITKLHVHEY